jgi:hypothetical protein
MARRAGGFTMVEMLVAATVIFILGALLVTTLQGAREQARRSSCGNDVGVIVKCCHLYADTSPQLGLFPLVDGRHDADGRKAMAMLYGAFVKDHRVFSCPSSPSGTAELQEYHMDRPDSGVLVAEYTNFAYDPGHTPVHAMAGIVSDRGTLHASNHRNSTNHGRDGPGQNVAIGAGSVEWWDDADHRATKDANDNATTDDMFADNLDAERFPEELETNIIP